jgi:hypothetical protein
VAKSDIGGAFSLLRGYISNTLEWTPAESSIILDVRSHRAGREEPARDHRHATGRNKAMTGIHTLDRSIGRDYPSFTTTADIRAFEQIPYADRIAAHSTFEALRRGAAVNPYAPAIQFLPNADPADTALVISYRELVARVAQAANMFYTLGVGPCDGVSRGLHRAAWCRAWRSRAGPAVYEHVETTEEARKPTTSRCRRSGR